MHLVMIVEPGKAVWAWPAAVAGCLSTGTTFTSFEEFVMRTRLSVLTGILLAHAGVAAASEKMYYFGQVRTSFESGQPGEAQVILLEKIHDPENNLIVERAISVKPDKSVEEYIMYMTVKGDSFTIKDNHNTISGSGKLFGPAWHWTYFKGTFESTAGVKIEDENFMSDPDSIVARKKITDLTGKVLLYMDISGRSISPQSFEILTSALLKR
jgi:hypothetical protein